MDLNQDKQRFVFQNIGKIHKIP